MTLPQPSPEVINLGQPETLGNPRCSWCDTYINVKLYPGRSCAANRCPAFLVLGGELLTWHHPWRCKYQRRATGEDCGFCEVYPIKPGELA